MLMASAETTDKGHELQKECRRVHALVVKFVGWTPLARILIRPYTIQIT